MPKIRLSKTEVEKLKFAGKQVEYFDTKLNGFAARVNKNGATYFCRFTVNGKQERCTIGSTSTLSYERALDRAKEILEDAELGISPAMRIEEAENKARNLAQEAKKEEARDVTLADVLKKYIITKNNLKKSTASAYIQLITDYCPEWKDTPIRNITSSMILSKHAEIGKRSEAGADGLMRVLRAVFNFASIVYDDIIIKNPVSSLGAVNAWYKVGRKKSYLPPDELNLFIPACLTLTHDTSSLFILTLLFTGLRKGEASSLTWGDIDLEEKVLIARDTKNGNDLEIPLSSWLCEKFTAHKKKVSHKAQDFVFPSTGKTGKLKDSRASFRSIANRTGCTELMPHDMRRSFISYCNNLKMSPFTIKRLVNHALPQDVTEGYLQFHIDDLRIEVERVADYILTKAGLKESGKVISIEEHKRKAA